MADTNSKFSMINGVPTRMPALDWASLLKGTSGNPITSYMANRNITPPVETSSSGPVYGSYDEGTRKIIDVKGGKPVVTLPPVQTNPTSQYQPPVVPPSLTQPPVASPVFQPQQQPTNNNQIYMDEFNKGLLDMLNSAKGVSTADFLKKKRELERASIAITSGETPENLRTLSADQQRSIRNAGAGALSPEIDANAYELEKAQQSIDNFIKVYKEASKFGTDFADKMQAPDSIIQNAKKIIEANPGSMSTVLAGMNDKTKQAVLGSLDYSALVDKKTTERKTSWQNGILYDDQTGEVIKNPNGSSNLSESDKYRKDSMKNITDFVDQAITQVGPGTAGFGSGALGMIAGSPAANLKSTLTTIKANIGFEALQAMRAASKTGGALGQVAVQELEALQSVLGSLSTDQSPSQLTANLKKIKEHYKNAMDAIGGASTAGGTDTASQIQEMRDLGYTDEQIQALMQQ
jgi:hypothetical protein